MPSIPRSEQQQKRFLKIHDYEYAFFSFFLIHLKLKRYIRSYTPSFPRKLSDSRPEWAKSIPVFRPKQRKTSTFWDSTYLWGLYEGVPPGGSNGMLTEKVGERFILTDQWWCRVTYDVIQYRLRKFHFYWWYHACCFTSTVLLHS